MARYQIEQNVERVSEFPSQFRWTVKIHVEDGDSIEATGTTKTQGIASHRADEFRRWAIITQDLFCIRGSYDDDDDDETPF